MVIAYFMREHNLGFEEAYRKVKSQRHIVRLNLFRSTPIQVLLGISRITGESFHKDRNPLKAQAPQALERYKLKLTFPLQKRTKRQQQQRQPTISIPSGNYLQPTHTSRNTPLPSTRLTETN